MEADRRARARGSRSGRIAPGRAPLFAAGVSTRLVHAIEAGKPTVRVDGLVLASSALSG